MTYRLNLLRLADIETLPKSLNSVRKDFFGCCLKCGNCCRYYDCPAFDPKNNICKVYFNRPTACRIYPNTIEELANVNCPGFHSQPPKNRVKPDKNNNNDAP